MFEVLIVVMILAIVGMAALPQLLETRDNYRLTAVASELTGNITNARIMSITRNVDVRVTTLSTTSYVLQQANGNNWTTQETMATGFTLAPANPEETAVFHSRGNACPVTTFTITNPNSLTRQVVVEASGRIHAQ